jgi:alpha-tubulin suppressor-like RCC1 family protein
MYVELGVGGFHGAGLLSNGQLVTWGSNSDCQRNVPPAPPGTNYVDVAAGPNHYVGLLSDGTTTTWGDESPVSSTQLSLPLLPSGVGYKAVACGQASNLGLRTDGIVEIAPAQATLPIPTPPLSYVQIGAHYHISVGRLSDGSAIAVGNDSTTGQPVTLSPVPAGVTILDIAAGWSHVARLRSDGIVTVDGSSAHGQHAVPMLPAGVSFVSLAASSDQTLAVLSDGTITGWGNGYYPHVPAPPPGLRYLQAAAGSYHGLGLLSDGTIAAWGYIGGYASISGETLVPAPPAGLSPHPKK